MPLRYYSSWEKRPPHPVTGLPANAYWEDDDGNQHPRWPTKHTKVAKLLTSKPALVWYSTSEAARVIGRHREVVLRYIRNGQLKATRGAGSHHAGTKTHWFINGADLLSFIRGQSRIVPAPAELDALAARIKAVG